MKTFSLISVLALSAALLSGCAAPARTDQMTAQVSPAQRIANTPMRNNIAVKDVSGGKETNPMWVSNVGNSEFEQALEGSLRDAGLLSAGKQAGKYLLTAHMQKVEQPMFGASMTVTVTVNYVLTERANGKEVLNRTVSLPFTAEWSSSFIGTERLRLANEGAIRVNIGKIIDELFTIRADQVALN
jgi:outer membrane murein-binding lipoprotein Lpp